MPLQKSKSFVLLALILAVNVTLHGQLLEDFSDGEIGSNPTWMGDVAFFQVNASGALQLNAPDAGNARLSTQLTFPDSAIWSIDVRLEFAPSAANLLRIYLMADQANLLTGNGYYLEIGENGTQDALRFFRQDDGASVLLATGPAGFVANEPVDVRLQIKRTALGAWTVEASAGPGMPPVFQFSWNDAIHSTGMDRYFGFYCLFTATRKDKFYFDNISIQPDVPDLLPPALLSAQATGDAAVSVLFDEDLDSLTALDPANYRIVGLGEATSAEFVAGSRRQVSLTFPFSLTTGSYTLESSGIADLAGNSSGVQQVMFSFVKVETADEFDVLINEIMADPVPGVGLPEVEWLELYNRSDKILDLSTLFLSDGGTPQPLPSFALQPDSFVVLCAPVAATALLAATPRIAAMPGFPSLNNDGDVLTLTDATGRVVDQVRYDVDWHNQNDKRNGGWSLERINPDLPCLAGENWQSCPNPPGGSPGLPNFSLQLADDVLAPVLLGVFPEDSFSLRLSFSEGLERTGVENTAAFTINPPLSLASASLAANDRSEVVLSLAEPLSGGMVYAMIPTALVTDCSGNPVSSTDTVFFGLPEIPGAGDVVVNELLFNPEVGGVDFVEFFNRSAKIFNWSEFFIANFDGGADVKPIVSKRLFLPGEHIVFTSNRADVLSRYAQTNPEKLVEHSLPSFPDDQGNVTLFWAKNGLVVGVDSFDYFDDYHNPLLSSSEQQGVSLERIRPDGPTNEASNWTSAARTGSGAGTPTRINSQFQHSANSGDALVTLSSERLSPDGDGWEDFLDIQYAVPDPGYVATVTIFDSGGAPVKRLFRQSLIGTKGALRWDGDLDDGTIARPGIYVLYLELFSPQGDLNRIKKPIAVVQRF